MTNIEAGDIKLTKKLDIDDRVFETTKRQAFITIKDHKPNFRNNIKTRLLNPTKPELGKVSKKILEAKIQILKKKTGFNQWKNNTSMLNWYIKQRQKHKLTFIQFDVDDFYGSIGEELLNDAIDWANKYVDITEDERKIILQSKKSILYHNQHPWTKKGEGKVDVTMGSNDGAETCDLVGLYLLSQLQDLGLDIGLYRDDGLALSKFSRRKNEQIKKKICEIFERNGLNITITANLKLLIFWTLPLI